MILVTAGRNIDNGNIALVVAEDKGKAYLIGYNDENGRFTADEKNEVFRIEISNVRLNDWLVYYNSIKVLRKISKENRTRG